MMVGAVGMVFSLFTAGALIYVVDVSTNIGVGITVVGLVCLFVSIFACSWGWVSNALFWLNTECKVAFA